MGEGVMTKHQAQETARGIVETDIAAGKLLF